MSTIEKLSIQGIRSFGSNAEDAQSITFSSPVTLILGENGCGKTTIIECLKYALTGESPPGSDRGKNFIHDPKIFGLTDTLGQIKLQVRNIRGERLSVSRSMKIANRRGKFSFETLDATMNYLNADGGDVNTDSISKRCIDVDLAMCQFMGVSKAIINNVLFCHQEDSSWPLDEPKKLKEKFDAIFGITEYNKAIEKIIKMRKEESDDLKVKEANLRLLVHIKKEMEDKSMSLKNAQEKCDKVMEQCSQCDANMKPIDERLLEIRKVEYEVGKHQANKVELETKKKNFQEQIANLSKKIKKVYDGNIDELDREIRSFIQNMAEKKIERNEMDGKLSNLKLEEKSLQKKFMDMDKKRCILVQQRQQEQECNSKRANKIKSLCDKLNISLTVDLEQAPDNVPDILEDIQSTLLSEECHIAETTSTHDQEDQKRQVEIDALRVDMTKLNEGVIALQKQKEQNEKECQVIESKVAEVEASTYRMKIVTEDIAKFDKLNHDITSKYDLGSMRQNIGSSKIKVKELQDQFRTLDDRLTRLNSISKQMSEISLKEKELEKKEQEVRRVKNKHSDNFKRLFPRPVETNFRRTLQVTYESLRRKIKELNEKASELKLKEQSHEIQRKNLKAELVRLEKDLEESKEQIFEKCHSTPYEELLAKCKVAVSKYQLDHGSLLSAESMYKRYIQKIIDDPCCPLCHKEMSGNEVIDLKTELSDEIHQLPENIKGTEKLLKSEQNKYEALLQLRPVIEKVTRLESDIPKRKVDLKQIEEKLFACANETESLQLLLAEPTSDLDLANIMMGDMSLLDEAIKEVSRLKEDIGKLKNKLPQGVESDVSIDDLQQQKTKTTSDLEAERKQLEKSQQTLEKIVETQNNLREKKNVLMNEQLKLQEGVQSLPQLKERKTELMKLLEVISVEIMDFKAKEPSLKQKFNAAVSEKSNQRENNRKKLAQMQEKLDSYKKIDHDIQRLHNEMMEYHKLNLSAELERLKDSVIKCKNDIAEKNTELTKLAEDLDVIKTECLNHESLERDLKDNRELKQLKQKEIEITEQYEKLSKQLGDLDFRKVAKEKNDLIEERDKATVRKGQLLGQIGEIKNQINRLESEIEEPKYKNSVKNYKRAHYEVEVSRRLISDLGQYRVALEWSLMQFHAEKMEKINRLIREYWRLIYRGNDIDYIQIQTDEMNTDSSADRRRSYNYHVIQSKNNSEIEMRGRCSAGQRVLASLIIRMALAETFSSNCGVLALDEPTTNLDRMNIMSLCDALNRIVDERQTQSNFMLIIITHDEDFISTLGKINSYHRVFRNDDCKSVVRKVKVA